MSKTLGVIKYERSVSLTMVAPAHSSHVEVNGVSLRLLEWQPDRHDGRPAIVLVHGLASNALLWQGAAVAFSARGHHVVAVDQRGHGHSEKPDHGYDMATVTTDLAGVLDVLSSRGMERPVVAGQSWGGNVVIELAHRHPDKTRGVVAVDGGFLELSTHFPEWKDCERALTPPNLLGTPATRMRDYMRAAHPDWPESGIDGQMGNFEVLEDGTIRPWLSLDRHLQILRGLWEHRPSELFLAITAPVLFTPADSNNGVFADTKRQWVTRALEVLPRSRVEWFHGADHDLHAQHPERFADVVSRAIDDGFFL